MRHGPPAHPAYGHPEQKQILLCAQDDNSIWAGLIGGTEVPPFQDKDWCRGSRGRGQLYLGLSALGLLWRP
jgi:hypothetical protein